jgi:hypothetical protein
MRSTITARGLAVVPVAAPDKPPADSDLAAIRFRVGWLKIPDQPPRIHALEAGLAPRLHTGALSAEV